VEQIIIAIGLFDEVDGTGLHRMNGAFQVALAGHHDDRQRNVAL